MKLSDMAHASILAGEYRRLISHADMADAGKIGVTVDGRYQPDAIIAAASGPVAAEFRRQAAEVEASLAGLGIRIA